MALDIKPSLHVLFYRRPFDDRSDSRVFCTDSDSVFPSCSVSFFAKEESESKPGVLLGILMKAFPLAAFCATAAFIYHSALFASGWFLYTIILALYGFTRLLKRGTVPLHELMIDGAWMYLALGGLWFWLYTADIQVMTFSPIIVLLTAIHFHYSAFLSRFSMDY